MADDDLARLGFSIDTAALQAARGAAVQLATALEGIANAADKEAAAAKRAAAEERKKAEETKKAAEEAKKGAGNSALLGEALGKIGMNASALTQHMNTMSGSLTAVGAAMGQGTNGLTGGVNALGGGLTRLGGLLGGVSGAAVVAAGAVAGIGAAVVGVMAVTIPAQEKFAMLEARLKNVYGSATVAASTFKELSDLAQRNGVAIDQTAESYLRLARNNEAIGLTVEQTIELTDAVQKLGRVSGASQGELSGGMMQFSQALAAGRLNGDELRSIMENMPALAKAIADGLGVSVGQLRAMGAEGELTAQKVVGALRSQIDEINREFAGLPDTTEQAFTRIGNSWERLLAGLGERIKASEIGTLLANAVASGLDAAADAATPETPGERVNRNMLEQQEAFNARNTTGFLSGWSGNRWQSYVNSQQGDDFSKVAGEALTGQIKAAYDSDRAALRAPYVASASIFQDIDKIGTQRKQIEEQIKGLQAAQESYKKSRAGDFEPQEIERIKKYENGIAALRVQLEGIKSASQTYREETARMAQDMAVYGPAAMGIGAEARAMVKSDNAKLVNTSEEEAINIIIARRTQEVAKQTAAMDAQIEEQQRLTAATGQGAEAQREAEIANKALNLQLQMFGTETTPEAEAAIERYADKLRELMRAQDDAAASAKLYAAEMEASINQQISAAIAAGATAGEIAALRLGLNGIQSISAAGAGNFPATLITSESGGDWTKLNDEGYGGRLQFGDARLADAAAAGIIPKMTGAEFSRQPPEVQQKVENWHFADIDAQAASRGLTKYIGQNVGGVDITLNGIRAMAHLGGIGGAQQFLESGGQYDQADSNGTKLSDYARAHGGSPTVGEQAAVATLQNQQTVETQRALQRLAEIERERRSAAEIGNAPDAASKREAQIEQQARQAASGYSGPEAEQIYAAEKAKLYEQDRMAADQRMKAYDEETEALKKQLDAAGLVGKAREVELEVIRRIAEEEAAGTQVTAEREAEIRKQVTERIQVSEMTDAAEEESQKFIGVWTDAAQSIGGALESAVRDAMMNGTVDAEDMLKGLVADITTSIMRAYITQPLTSGISDWISSFSAHGNVFAGGNVVPFARGGIVNSPTIFPMARGAGLMGEAGPEAILPLKRGSDGRLGVGGGNNGTSIVINDMRTASGSEPVDVQEQTGPDGRRIVQVTVRDEVRRQIRAGELDSPMRANFGVARTLTKR